MAESPGNSILPGPFPEEYVQELYAILLYLLVTYCMTRDNGTRWPQAQATSSPLPIPGFWFKHQEEGTTDQTYPSPLLHPKP
jgi:hypothetical protein